MVVINLATRTRTRVLDGKDDMRRLPHIAEYVTATGSASVFYAVISSVWLSIMSIGIGQTASQRISYHCANRVTATCTSWRERLAVPAKTYCSACGRMAEVKSRKKSGTLRWESDLKAQGNTWVRGNDYGLILRQQTTMPARGRDTRKGEKIVWTAANMKLQNARIKSRADNKSIPYQRGAKAIARQINRDTEGKAGMTEEQARFYIDSWYERYPRVRDYVDHCKWCVNNPGFMDTPWGRRRHFYMVDNKSVMAGQERECVNFGIQATIADCLNTALYNIWRYKKDHPEYDFNIVLAIHDAALLEVPVASVAHVMDFVLPICMKHGVTVPASDRSPEFQLDIDPEISFRWGETPTRAELAAVGVSEKYWSKQAA